MFLNTDAIAAIEQKLSGMQNEENSSQTENEPVAREVEVNVQAKNDVNDEDRHTVSSAGAAEEKEQHSVPYKRFQEVNASKKELKAKASRLEQELQEARKEIERVRQTKPTQETKDNFYEEIERQLAEGDHDPRYSGLEKRLNAYEEKMAAAELDVELKTVRKSYPDVPEEVMLQAVINDPNVSLMDVAKEWSQFVAEIEERALARAGVSKTSTPSAPKRPQGATGGVSVSAAASSKPRTMADAKAAALAYFKQHGL